MTSFRKWRSGSTILISLVALSVIALAALQYRWIIQASVDEQERLNAQLRRSVEVFHQSFLRELMSISGLFRRDEFGRPGSEMQGYARALDDWRTLARFPGIVSALYVARTGGGGGGTEFSRLNLDTGMLESLSPDGRLMDAAVTCVAPVPGSEEGGNGRRPGAFWSLAETGGRMLLIRSLFFRDSARKHVPGDFQPAGYLFAELDARYLREYMFPEIARLAFGGAGESPYHVGVFQSEEAAEPIYVSESGLERDDFSSADVKRNLMEFPQDRSPGFRGPGGPQNLRRGRPGPPLVISPCNDELNWNLLARHREGSVSVAVARLRRRNLAVSFGVLLLMVLSLGTLLVATQRAQRLAKMQVNFTAGVSHELRTPLAVIRSAADNLAHGTISDSSRVKEYGALIRREGRRLSGLVESTLQFAAVQRGVAKLDLRPYPVGRSIDEAVRDSAPTIEEFRAKVQSEVSPGLPLVLVDRAALSQCLQNLISNAAKYGGEKPVIRISAAAASDGDSGDVLLSVEDRGSGIAPEDLPRIFDRFYQGSSGSGVKSKGFGLGLRLTKDLIEAMGGSISVQTEEGAGARFTLHLNRAEASIDEEANTAG